MQKTMVQTYELIKKADRESKTDDMILNLIYFQISNKLTDCVTLSVRVWEGEWSGKIFALLLPNQWLCAKINCCFVWNILFIFF